MDFRLNPSRIFAKKVWWVRGNRFESDKGTRNGEAKAFRWCDENDVNRKEVVRFDSETEWKRYEFLLGLEREGKVRDIQVHRPFVLVPWTDGHTEMAYEADFCYETVRGGQYSQVVEDVKPWFHLEDVFLVKWKLFDYVYRGRLRLSVVMLKPWGKDDFANPDSWLSYGEGMRKPPNPNTADRLKNARELERKAKELASLVQKYKKLNAIERRTKAQERRLCEVKDELRRRYVLLE